MNHTHSQTINGSLVETPEPYYQAYMSIINLFYSIYSFHVTIGLLQNQVKRFPYYEKIAMITIAEFKYRGYTN